MRNIMLIIVGLASCAAFEVKAQDDKPDHGTLAFVDGHILSEDKFARRNIYAVDGVLSFEEPSRVDTVIDLGGKYLIPPFGDAHTHNLDREWQLGFLPDQYLAEGTFYVLNLVSKLDGAKAARAHFATKNSIDVRFANQGLTSTLGHPFLAYEPFAMGIHYAEWEDRMEEIKASRLDENNAYIFLDTEADIKNKLPQFFTGKPDVVKIVLLNSQDFEDNFGNGIAADHGLSIEVARQIVKQSHKQNLPVYAHIESRYDFLQAIEMGVDHMAHMPGYGWNGATETYQDYFVGDELLSNAAKKGVGIIPTIEQALLASEADSLKKVNFVKDFLTRYHRFGGKILIGSDIFNKTLSPEIDLLIELDVFDNATILQILCQDTPRNIFPDRKIGALEEGYEASFLVLDRNPLLDTGAIKDIHLKVKQGIVLD